MSSTTYAVSSGNSVPVPAEKTPQVEVEKQRLSASAERLYEHIMKLEDQLGIVMSEAKQGEGHAPDGSVGLCSLAADLYKINSVLEAAQRVLWGISGRLEL